ncbi:MAG: FG-GAP repeat protein, partial [Planctomycetota bacterium]
MAIRSRSPITRLIFIVFIFLVSLLAGPVLGQCDPTTDCNGNGVLDECDIIFGSSDDCNLNAIPDECDIASAFSDDCDVDGIPDECEPVGELELAPAGGPFATGAGEAVAIEGDRAVVGASGDATLGLNAGAAHLFRRIGTRWVEEATLTASDGAAGDLFGISVAINGDLVVIGASGNDEVGLDAGAAYLFRLNGASWVEEAKLTASDGGAGDEFGASVAADGDTVLIGAPQTAVLAATGTAYIFTGDGVFDR